MSATWPPPPPLSCLYSGSALVLLNLALEAKVREDYSDGRRYDELNILLPVFMVFRNKSCNFNMVNVPYIIM